MADYKAAKGLAGVVARRESEGLKDGEYYVIRDQNAVEHEWGWEFSPVIEPYCSLGRECPYVIPWNIEINRFTDEVQLLAYAAIENDDFPMFNLTLRDAGENKGAVLALVRQLTGWTATEAKFRLDHLPVVVYAGTKNEILSIFESLRSTGATISITQWVSD